MNKPILGYEGLYRIDSNGIITTNDGVVVEPVLHPRTQYPTVLLWNDDKCTRHSVHVLVATHFVPNPNGYVHVKHLVSKQDSAANNLVWSKSSDSLLHQIGVKLASIDKKQMQEFMRTMLFHSCMAGTPFEYLVKEANICFQRLHINFKQIAIKLGKAEEYDIFYAKRKAQRVFHAAGGRKITVNQYDLLGHLVHTYDSVKAAATAMNTTTGVISNAANGRNKTYKGYIWKYE